ncbi:MAG: ABC transporter substrate-binding protein [Ruminococcaceae bacterium]|nr:ABC transporter substrate-binding protein [Oscillospiraceae bacterium]
MKRLLSILLAVVFVFALASCNPAPQTGDTTAPQTEETPIPQTGEMDVYVLAGPTGIGAVNLWAKAEAGETQNTYNFNLVAANDEILAAISKGEADIAAVATNLASTLYNKTEGKVTVLAVNTLGVLSILTKDTELNSIADLKGKTLYTPGQGANPEYILRYVLEGNGIDPDKDLTVKFVGDGSELPAIWAKEPDAVIMAPQPVATSILMKYTDAKTAFDMTAEWEKISGAQNLMMGCVIVRNEYLAENSGAVNTFLKEYEESVNAAKADAAATGALCEKYGIIPKAAIATKAIPSCGLSYVDGADMKAGLSAYLDIMFKANPKSVGGALPADDFYYAGK